MRRQLLREWPPQRVLSSACWLRGSLRGWEAGSFWDFRGFEGVKRYALAPCQRSAALTCTISLRQHKEGPDSRNLGCANFVCI